MKRCSTSFAMKEMKMKIILSYHYILPGMANTKKSSADSEWWQGCGEIR